MSKSKKNINNIKYATDKLVNININGIEFYLKSSAYSFGDKWIEDELPSQGRIMRFFGKKETDYKLLCIAELEQYEKLRGILKTTNEKPLTLQTPLEGIKQVLFTNITDVETFIRLGIVEFTLELKESILTTETSQLNIFDITGLIKENTEKGALSTFSNFIKTTTLNISLARNKIANVSQTIQVIIGSFEKLEQESILLNQTINSIINDANNLIGTPLALIDTFSIVYSNLSNTFTNIDDSLSALDAISQELGLSDVDESSQYSKENTLFENTFNSSLLALAIVNTTDLILEKQFIYDYNITMEQNRIQHYQELCEKIYHYDLKNQCLKNLDILYNYINEKKQYTKKRQTYITRYDTTDDILCYKIYGSLDNINLLREWSNLKQHGFIKAGTEIIYYL